VILRTFFAAEAGGISATENKLRNSFGWNFGPHPDLYYLGRGVDADCRNRDLDALTLHSVGTHVNACATIRARQGRRLKFLM